MPAKILIMSGARAGDEVVMPQDEFRAGGQAGCELHFPPAADPAAAGRVATFRRTADGWFVRSAGSGTLWLNADPLTASRPIRSGDIVRLSDEGPDLEFTIVAQGMAANQGTAAKPAASAPPAGIAAAAGGGWSAGPTAERTAPVQPGGWMVTASASSAAQPTTPQPAAVAPLREPAAREYVAPGRPPASPSAATRGVLPLVMAGVGVAVVAGAVVVWQLSTHRALPPLQLQSVAEQTVEVNSPLQFRVRLGDPAWEKSVRFGLSASAPPGAALDNTTGEFRWTPAAPGQYQFRVEAVALDGSQQQCDTTVVLRVIRAHDAESSPKPGPQAESSARPEPAPPGPSENVAAALVLQLELDDAGATWPFASGVAVGRNLVLTSAAAARDLLEFRRDHREHCKVWATHDAPPLKLAVEEIRIHARYLQLLVDEFQAKQPANATELRSYDLALLTVKGELPHVAKLASSEEATKLAEGYPLTLIGYTFAKGDKVSEYFQPAEQRRQLPCRVFAILTPPGAHAGTGSRSLAFRAELPDAGYGAWGSPLYNRQGEVMGVYSEAASKEEHVANLRYAAAVNAALVPGDAAGWIAPVLEAPAAKPEAGR